ncbi:hypothetical protein SAMN02910409_0566 [Prevotellaceae bacterium HUN156]|nr:hypothetical protein SAMN02910409_0566 [Prevotellaceae bacterium HUN156]
MNETTIFEKRPTTNGQNESKKVGGSWKHVTLGGVSGILMGAGLLYAGQTVAATKPEDSAAEEPVDESAASQQEASPLPVAQMHNEMSFGEAFAAARAEVGPGAVFIWHGGIYNTYTAEEWNAMTPEQKSDFAQQVNPEIPAHQLAGPTDAQPDVAVQTASEDVQVVDEQTAQTSDADADVHIVGQGEIEGHAAVALDMNNDGDADVAIIDVNDNHVLDNDDVVVDTQGNMARYGDLIDADPNQMAAMENPDVAPDMPDYMNDALIDA